jgi:hypothetical protein
VVATAGTGHADVVNPGVARVIGTPTEVTLSGPGGAAIARWPEPSLEETIEGLEWAYQNRGALKAMGDAAGKAMAEMTWEKTARGFLGLMG